MKKKILCGAFILLFISGFTRIAFAGIGSQSFCITTSVISGGGSVMSSANFHKDSTLGQSSPLSTGAPPGSANFVLSPGFWHTIDVISSGERTFVMNLPEGWSMMSIPVLPNDASIQELFPGARVIYGYEMGIGYVRTTDLETCAGYWISLNEAKEFTITGQSVNGCALTVNEPGWNMIGVPILEAKAISDNCDIAVIYSYVQGIGYQRVQLSENLQPGKGYWILLKNLTGQCQLTVGNPSPGP